MFFGKVQIIFINFQIFQVLSIILKKLNVNDLLAASEVSKLWREAATPVIADSVCVQLDFKDEEIITFDQLTIPYKKMAFYVSFLIHSLYVSIHFHLFIQILTTEH